MAEAKKTYIATDNWLEFDTQVIINNKSLLKDYEKYLEVKIQHMKELEKAQLDQLKESGVKLPPQEGNNMKVKDYMEREGLSFIDSK